MTHPFLVNQMPYLSTEASTSRSHSHSGGLYPTPGTSSSRRTGTSTHTSTEFTRSSATSSSSPTASPARTPRPLPPPRSWRPAHPDPPNPTRSVPPGASPPTHNPAPPTSQSTASVYDGCAPPRLSRTFSGACRGGEVFRGKNGLGYFPITPRRLRAKERDEEDGSEQPSAERARGVDTVVVEMEQS